MWMQVIPVEEVSEEGAHRQAESTLKMGHKDDPLPIPNHRRHLVARNPTLHCIWDTPRFAQLFNFLRSDT